MHRIEWDDKNEDGSPREPGFRYARNTPGRRRCMKKRFRGPGMGKHSYPDGVNPVRAAHGGSIPQGED